MNQALYPIATMCRLLGVSTSGYYAWCARGPSPRAQEDARLSRQIHTIHKASRGTHGVPRVHAELWPRRAPVWAASGSPDGCGGWACKGSVSARERVPPCVAFDQRPAPDLVQRAFTAPGPNRLWVADITYLPTWAGFLYLAVVLDAFSRRIIGWSMATHLRTELVLDALEMALSQRRPQEVIRHSDQGCQYTSIAFGQRCKTAGVRPSMGSVGDCYDNAMAESFFATLECELLDRVRFQTPAEARVAVFEFIEAWYNPRRRHSALDYRSPVHYEQIHQMNLEPRKS